MEEIDDIINAISTSTNPKRVERTLIARAKNDKNFLEISDDKLKRLLRLSVEKKLENFIIFMLKSHLDQTMQIKSKHNKTILHWSAVGGLEKVCDYAVSNLPNEFLKMQDVDGNTFLHLCAKHAIPFTLKSQKVDLKIGEIQRKPDFYFVPQTEYFEDILIKSIKLNKGLEKIKNKEGKTFVKVSENPRVWLQAKNSKSEKTL